MEIIFLNTENRKTNEPHRFRLTLADKLNLKHPNKTMILTKLSIYLLHMEKKLSLHISTTNLKSLLQPGMMNLIYLIDHILLQTFKIILSTLLKNMKQ